MAHDLENPRTKRYSKLKSIIRDIELIFKKGFLFLFILINLIFHSKKKIFIDIENYNEKDNRCQIHFTDFLSFLICNKQVDYDPLSDVMPSPVSH